MEIWASIAEILAQVKKMKPLVHHLTNYVTANDCANVVLAVGGSPVMAHEPKEVEEMVSQADSLVLNIGTLDEDKLGAMLLAGKRANERGIPVVLDPVGVGATRFRSQAAEQLLGEVRPAVIRGNQAEIKKIAGLDGRLRGVDSWEREQTSPRVVQALARRLGCVVAMTGKRDVISDGRRLCVLENGHPMLSRITGSGCMSTSLVAACCGVTGDYFLAAVTGLSLMGLAGERAAQKLKAGEGPGSFKVNLLDSIYCLASEEFWPELKLVVWEGGEPPESLG